MKPAKRFWLGLALGIVIGVLAALLLTFLVRRALEVTAPVPRAPMAPPALVPAPAPEAAKAEPEPRPKLKRKGRRGVAQDQMHIARAEPRDAQILQEEVESLRRQLAALQDTHDATTHPLVGENRVLRAELEKARTTLRAELEDRTSLEGQPVPFPEDLADRYKQDAMLKAVGEALRAAGVPGEVRAVDCDEYPCIVYGDVRASSPAELDRHFRNAEKQLQRDYPSERDAMSTSLFAKRGKEGDDARGYFGMSIYPKPEDGQKADQDEMRKRMRHRQSQYMDSLRQPGPR